MPHTGSLPRTDYRLHTDCWQHMGYLPLARTETRHRATHHTGYKRHTDFLPHMGWKQRTD
ncbi:hypothetical protein GCM10009100_27190 [Thalassospira tepidiphila]